MAQEQGQDKVEIVIKATDEASPDIIVTSDAFDDLRKAAISSSKAVTSGGSALETYSKNALEATDKTKKFTKETDNVKKSVDNAGVSLEQLGEYADFATQKLTGTTLAVASLSLATGSTLYESLTKILGQIGQVSRETVGLGFSIGSVLKEQLTSPVAQTLFDTLREQAEKATQEIAPLSGIIKEVTAISKPLASGFGQEIFRIDEKDFKGDLSKALDDVGDNFSKSIKDSLASSLGLADSPEFERLFDKTAKLLDKKLADQLVDGSFAKFIGEGPVQEFIKNFAKGSPQIAANLSSSLATISPGKSAFIDNASLLSQLNSIPNQFVDNFKQNSAIKNTLPSVLEEAFSGSFTGAVKSGVTNSFSDIFNQLNGVVTSKSAQLGGVAGRALTGALSERTKRNIDITKKIFGNTFDGVGVSLVRSLELGTKIPLLDKLIPELIGVNKLDKILGGAISGGAGKLLEKKIPAILSPLIGKAYDYISENLGNAGSEAIANGLTFLLPRAMRDAAKSNLIESGTSRKIFNRLLKGLQPDNLRESIEGIAPALINLRTQFNTTLDKAATSLINVQGLVANLGIGFVKIAPKITQAFDDGLLGAFLIVDSLQETVDGAFTSLSFGVLKAFEAITTGASPAAEAVGNIGMAVDGFLADLKIGASGIGNPFGGIFSNAALLIEDVQSGLAEVNTYIQSFATDIGEVGLNIVSTVLGGFDGLLEFTANLQNAAIASLGGIDGFLEGLKVSAEGLGNPFEFLAFIVGKVGLVLNKLGLTGIDDVIYDIQNSLFSLGNPIVGLIELIQSKLPTIIPSVEDTINTIFNFATDSINGAKNAFLLLSADISSYFQDLSISDISFDDIFAGINESLESFKDGLLGFDPIVDTISGLQSVFAFTFGSIQENLDNLSSTDASVLDPILNSLDKLQAGFNSVFSAISGQLLSLYSTLPTAFSDTINEIVANIPSAVSKVNDFIDGFVGAIESQGGFGQFVNSIIDSFIEVADTVSPILVDLVDFTENKFNEIVQYIRDNGNEWLKSFATTVGDVLGFINDNFVPGLVKAFEVVDDLLGGTLSTAINTLISNAAQSFVDNFFGTVFNEFAEAIDAIDQAVLKIYETIASLPEKIAQPLDILSSIPEQFAGFNEPLEVFGLLETAVGSVINSVSVVTERIAFFSQGLTALQSLAETGPFRLLIGQTVELREQLLSTQSTLVGTSKIINQLTNQEVTDPTQAIQSLEGPIRQSIEKMRQESLELVGVTSNDLVPIFQQIAGQITSIGGGLNDAKDLSLDFAATLGTLGVPLNQSQQEISSILTAQIDQNSVIAKALNITNEQVNTYRSQGRLIGELRKRLEAFRAGNALAAQSLSGISSNIQEIFDEIGRKAGEPLLDPLLKQIDGVYKFLTQNQKQLVDYFSKIANQILRIGLAFTDLGQNAVKIFGGIVAEAPLYLFESLANAAEVLTDSVKQTLEILKPFINVLGEMVKAAGPLGGQFLSLFLSIKSLSIGVKALGQGFSLLSQLIPGLGDVLFALDLRSQGLVNQFTNMAGVVGTGASGFLILGKYLDKIPGAADAVSGALGPLGSLIIGFVPTIATLGIQLVGLIKLFPPIGTFINTLITAAPAALASLGILARGNTFLAPFAGLFDQASLAAAGFANATDRVAFVNAKFKEVMVTAGRAIAGQVLAFGLLAGGAFLAFTAFDKFVLQNEKVKEAVFGVIEGLGILVNTLKNVLLNPIGLLTIALTGVAIAIRLRLIPAIYELIAVQLATWISAAASGFTGLAGILGILRFSQMAQGATTVGIALQALTIYLTQGSVAAAQFLATNNISVVTLGVLQIQLNSTIVSMKAFIVSTYESAVALATNMVTAIKSAVVGLFTTTGATGAASGGFLGLAKSILIASGAMIKRLILSIGLAIISLYSMATAGGTAAFSFKRLAAAIFLTAIESIKALLASIVSSIAGLFGLGGAAGVSSAGFATLATTIWSAVAGLAALLLPITLVVAAIAAVGAAIYLTNKNAENEALQIYAQQTAEVSQRSLAFAEKLKKARDLQADADKRGVRLTDEQYKANARLLKQSELKLQDIQAQIVTLKEAQASASNSAKEGYQTQIDELERLKKSYAELTSNIKTQPKELATLGGAYTQLAEKAKGAEEAILNSSGDSEVFKQKGQELIDFTNKQLELGQITADEARRRFRLLSNNVKADQEIQLAAIEAITAAYKAQGDDRVRLVQTSQEVINAELIGGALKIEEAYEAIAQAQKAPFEDTLKQEQINHQARLERIEKEYQAEKFKAEASLAFEQQKAKDNAGTFEGEKALANAEEYRKMLLDLEKKRNQDLQAETERNGKQTINLSNRISQIQTDNATKAAELRAKVSKGIISEEQAADQLLTASKKVELESQLSDIKTNYEERKRITEKQFDDDAKLLLDKIREKQAEADKSVEGSDAYKSAQQDIIAYTQQLSSLNAAKNLALGNLDDQYLNETKKKNGEILKTEAEGQKRQSDLLIKNLEQNQKKALDILTESQNKRLVAIQTLENAGLVSSAAVEEVRALNIKRTTAEQLDLEKQRLKKLEALPQPKSQQDRIDLENKIREARLKTQDLTLQSLGAERKAYEAHIANIRDILKRENNAYEAALEARQRAGLIGQTQVDLELSKRRVANLQKEIALETKNISRRSDLYLELEKAKTAVLEAELAARRQLLETENLEYQNQLEAQNQVLRRQTLLYEVLGQALEQRNKLLEAGKNLAQAASNFVTGELDVLSSIERSEYRRKQLAEIAAATKLEALRKQQEFERESLEIQIKQNELALEREAIQNRIAQSEKLSAIAQTAADIEIEKADPRNNSRSGRAKIAAMEFKQRANIDALYQLQLQGGLIGEQRKSQGELAAAQRRQLQLGQQVAEDQALAAFVQALPPGRQQRAARALRARVAGRFGYASEKEFREAGLSRSRNLASKELGIPTSPDILGAINPELGGLGDTLNASQFQKAVAATEKQFAAQYGGTAGITSGLTTSFEGKPQLQMMPEFQGKLTLPSPTEKNILLSLENSGVLFQDAIGKLIKFLGDQNQQANTYNIEIKSGDAKRSASGQTNSPPPTIESVLKRAKQLANVNS